MRKIPFRKIYKIGRAFLVNHSADILTGFTACGVVLTAIQTHKATLKADAYLRINGYDMANPDTQKVLKWQSRKNYILPAATGALTIGAAIGANYINHKQIAGLAAACSAAELALTEHRDKIEELFGEKSLKELDDGLMHDAAVKGLLSEAKTTHTGHGNTLCIEGITGQKVYASPEWFYAVRNRFNQEVNSCTYASVAEYLEMLYTDCTEPYYIPEWCNEQGYNVYITGLLEFCTPHWEGDAEGEAIVVFKPTHKPVHNYMENF